jgi:hypothetical protein
MNNRELLIECQRLLNCKTIDDLRDALDIYINYFYLVHKKNLKEKTLDVAIHEARIVSQMIFTKTCSLKKLLDGIDYTFNDGARITGIIDATVIASFIRTLYETVGMFNVIYINPKSKDERIILYNLWVHSGLKYRQKFMPSLSQTENLKKFQEERKKMDQLWIEIEDTELFKSLNEENKRLINKNYQKKDYKIEIKDNTVKCFYWQDLIEPMGIRASVMGEIYTYFSLYAHPSNVSVFQFGEMFKKDDPQFLLSTNYNVKNAFFLLSVFIADYIKLFPEILTIFNNLDLKSQIVIDTNNVFARDARFSINNAYQNLEE